MKRTKTMDGEIEEERGGVGMGRDMIVPLCLSLLSLVFVSSRVMFCRLRKKERERESFPFHPI